MTPRASSVATYAVLLTSSFFPPGLRELAAQEKSPPTVTKDTTSEVLRGLISELGNDSFIIRERASRELEKLVLADITAKQTFAVLTKTLKHRDLEIARRAEHVLVAYYDVRPTGYPMPWIDSLPKDHPDRAAIISKYLCRAQATCGYEGAPDWPAYRYATCLWTRELLDSGKSRSEILKLMKVMREGDYEQCRKAGWPTADGK